MKMNPIKLMLWLKDPHQIEMWDLVWIRSKVIRWIPIRIKVISWIRIRINLQMP
jgi:hypothetical protein